MRYRGLKKRRRQINHKVENTIHNKGYRLRPYNKYKSPLCKLSTNHVLLTVRNQRLPFYYSTRDVNFREL